MPHQIDLDTLLAACSDDSFEDGIRIDSELEPCGGPGSPVKPAVYEGGRSRMPLRRRLTPLALRVKMMTDSTRFPLGTPAT